MTFEHYTIPSHRHIWNISRFFDMYRVLYLCSQLSISFRQPPCLYGNHSSSGSSHFARQMVNFYIIAQQQHRRRKRGVGPLTFVKGGLAPAPSFLHSRFCTSYCVVTVVTDNFILRYWYWHYYNIIFWNQHSFCSRSLIQSQSFRHRPDQ